MNVLIVSFFYAPEIGAAPSRIYSMAKGIQSHGHKVEVLTCMPNYPKGRIFEKYRGCLSRHEEMNDIKVHRYWTYATLSKNPIRRILSMFSFAFMLWCFAIHFLRIRRYDRVIIQSPPLPVGMSAILLFKCLYHRQTIVNISDLWPISAVELGALREGSAIHKLLLWMERFIYKHADAVQGQSQEILDHVLSFYPEKRTFLYRNLQLPVKTDPITDQKKHPAFRIIYAGLLGVAQDVLSIIEQIDFKALGTELHIFGGGIQLEQIEAYIRNHDTGIFYHGFLEKAEMIKELQGYDASIVPLTVQITGAVPSKIFDLMSVGVPILLCGSGEAAAIVRDYGIGLVSAPQDIDALRENIQKMAKMTSNEQAAIKQKCIDASKQDFSFENQMNRYSKWFSGN